MSDEIMKEAIESGSGIALDGLVRKLDDAYKRIGKMCSEGRPPSMSIPARPDVDDDLVICDAISDAKKLVRYIIDPVTRCEGCNEPATTTDSEGVDLCEECAKACDDDFPNVKDQAP